MADPYFLQSLGLVGFRAYLKQKEFNFSQKRCLAIFAPNGHGKSSVIDALEFMLSKDGTLERLGQRAINNQAGPSALAHNLSEEAKIKPAVTISIISGKNVTNGNRSATGTKRPIPGVATTLNACFVVPPIIRGHALRAFVETDTPEERYANVANWLQLGPLVEVQKNIRALRTHMKSAAEDATALQRVDTQLSRDTTQAVKAWDTAAVLTYVNTSVLAPLDATLKLTELVDNDPVYLELKARAKAEENKIGLAGLRQFRNAAAALWEEVADTKQGETVVRGAISTFNTAVVILATAKTKEIEERSKAANTAFQALWKVAEPLFAIDLPESDVCPICATPVADTVAGSTEMIRNHISKHLEELADYAAAKKVLDEAKTSVTKAHTQLVAVLPGLIGLVEDAETALKAALIAYQASIASWSQGAVPASDSIKVAIIKLLVNFRHYGAITIPALRSQ